MGKAPTSTLGNSTHSAWLRFSRSWKVTTELNSCRFSETMEQGCTRLLDLKIVKHFKMNEYSWLHKENCRIFIVTNGHNFRKHRLRFSSRHSFWIRINFIHYKTICSPHPCFQPHHFGPLHSLFYTVTDMQNISTLWSYCFFLLDLFW